MTPEPEPEPAQFVTSPEHASWSEPPPAVLDPPHAEAGPLVPVPVDMRNAAVTLLAVIAGVLVLQYAQPVFIPLVLGLLISYALDPVVTRLERMRLARPLGAALVLLVVVAGTSALVYQLRFQMQAIVEQLPAGAR